MAKKKKTDTQETSSEISDYRFNEKRKYITPAGLAAQGVNEPEPKQRFFYDPHLPPVLRFDETGGPDKLPELLAKAKKQALSDDDLKILAAALKKQEPWLEWTGKREKKYFEVDPVALHIHERVSTQAILKVAKREPVQRNLFADPEMEYREAIKFYKHDMDWANRLILGDSLQVMASLAYRENLIGQVQMIYFDPPYGIKFNSNFQSEVSKREVKDKDNDLTREPEVVKAYRDTWTLGIHSYLSYLRERFIIARTLLKAEGSLFVQIGKENLEYLKMLLNNVFGEKNFVGIISVKKTAYQASNTIANVADYILWFAKDIEKVAINPVYISKLDIESIGLYKYYEIDNGFSHIITDEEEAIPENSRRYRLISTISQGESEIGSQPFEFNGETFSPPSNNHWKTNLEGLERVKNSDRLVISGSSLAWKGYIEDFPVSPINNIWTDTMTGSFTEPKVYVVQTNTKIISRCLQLVTKPGDLVLDPTCGSGTTAYVAEQWGRRWITIDTSRVAVALARQRLLTAKFEHYKTKKPDEPLSDQNGFIYEHVSHITLKSIAQNIALDPIFAKFDPQLDEKLNALNKSLKKVSKELRTKLNLKLIAKQKAEGKKSIT